jgi:hypothetical protein
MIVKSGWIAQDHPFAEAAPKRADQEGWKCD